MLLVYWLFTALISIFPTRTRIEQSPNGLADSLPLLKLLFTVVASFVFGLENITKPDHRSLIRPDVDKVVQAKPSTEPHANLFSRFTFVLVLPLLNKGKIKTLRMEDIWSLHPKMLSYPLLLSTQARIDADEAIARQKAQDLAEKKTGAAPGETTDTFQPQKIRLFSILIHTVGWAYLTGAIPCLLYTIVMYSRPVLLSGLITFMSSYTEGSKEKHVTEQPAWKGYGLMLGVLTMSVLGDLFNAQYQNICFQCSICARGVFNSLIYRKALRLSSTNKQEGMGSIVNHTSIDVDNVLRLFVIFHTLWSSIVGVVIALVLLYQQVQYAMFASLGVTFGVAVVGGFISSMTGKVYEQMSVKNDHRMKLVNELVNHIKSIKLYAWERYFVRHISEARLKQLNSLRLFNIIVTIQLTIYNVGTPLSAFALLTLYSYTAPPGAPLNLEKIFTSLILLNMLDDPLSYLANTISHITSGHVSYVRLRTSLESEEINPANVERHPNASLSEIACEVNNGTFDWYSPEAIKKLEEKRKKEAIDTMRNKTDVTEADQKDEMIAIDEKSGMAGSDAISESTAASIKEKNDESASDTLGPFLRNVSLSIKRGSLTAIIGRVGEGKSSLVAALLGEIGSVRAYGPLAYVAQSAWILNDTVRNNILFDREYDKEWYLQVINACALAPDLKMLIHGDETLIGEKGVNLSGGQQQRISIARAVYANADVYIFDDPLSAVDAHVDRHIFEEAVTKILGGKTRILGRISQDGTYENLMQDTQGDLYRMIAESKAIVSKESCNEPAVDLGIEPEGLKAMTEKTTDEKEKLAVDFEERPTVQQRKSVKTEDTVDLEEHDVVDDEVNSEGTLSDTQGKDNDKINLSYSNQYWISTYLAWILFTSASLVLALVTFLLLLARKASKSLHASIINPLVRSLMSFFDVTLSGKIINRFAHDFSTIDMQLPFYLVFIFLNFM
ncbi:Canalicular multispecific organic anion transporter 1, partial [Podila verticillata]